MVDSNIEQLRDDVCKTLYMQCQANTLECLESMIANAAA